MSVTEDEDSIRYRIKRELALNSAQEHVILEMTIGAIQAVLSSASPTSEKRRGRKPKAATSNRTDQEENAKQISEDLIPLMPRLLKKFSADPDSACDILRLHNCIDLQSYQTLRQKQSYENTLDSFCKLFMAFDSSSLVREFINAVISGQKSEYLSESVDIRTRDLLDEICNEFKVSVRIYDDLAVDAIGDDSWHDIIKPLSKLMHLAAAVNVSEAISYKAGESDKSMATLLCSLSERGVTAAEQEVSAVMASISILRYFILWKTQYAMLMHSSVSLRGFREIFDDIVAIFERIILSETSSELRQSAIMCLVDILSAANVMLKKESLNIALDVKMSPAAQKATVKVFLAQEKSLAAISKVKLQKASVLKSLDKIMSDAKAAKERTAADEGDDEVEETEEAERAAESDYSDFSEDEAEDEELAEEAEEGEEDQADATNRVSEKIEAEIKLCEIGGRIVRGILNGSIDKKYAKRVALNSKVLGPAFEKIASDLLAPLLKA